MVVLSVMYLWIFTFYRNYQYEFFTVALYFTIRHLKTAPRSLAHHHLLFFSRYSLTQFSNLSFMHSPCSFPQALLSALQALSSMIASPPRSPVRILIAVISSDTKILPSPTCPVLQVSRIVSISFSNGVS